jgi:hypothetical protein
MMSLLAGNAAITLLKAVEYPLEKTRNLLVLRAARSAARKGAETKTIRVELTVTEDQLRRIISDPEIKKAILTTEALKTAKQLPVCARCGAVEQT